MIQYSQCLLQNKMHQNDNMYNLKFVIFVSDPPIYSTKTL